jgi:hypothetical protein
VPWWREEKSFATKAQKLLLRNSDEKQNEEH